VSDEDLQRMTYRDLWLAELGATVPQWDGAAGRPFDAVDVDRWRQVAPDPNRDLRRA
jgi:hypothetical protein